MGYRFFALRFLELKEPDAATGLKGKAPVSDLTHCPSPLIETLYGGDESRATAALADAAFLQPALVAVEYETLLSARAEIN